MKIALFILLLLMQLFSISAESSQIKIATWNIEHLGSPGRGLGGIGSGPLPIRSESDIQKIVELIIEENIQLLALQEVAITSQNGPTSFTEHNLVSYQLEIMCTQLGSNWKYFIANSQNNVEYNSVHNMQNCFLWNSNIVFKEEIINFEYPNIQIGSKRILDRNPLMGYFSILHNNEIVNDFLLINLHLASGQNNYENHIATMIIIEQSINSILNQHDITESDRIILGDFNDNPYATDNNNQLEYSKILYDYMAEKGYINLVTEDIIYTRVNSNLDSIIDHILVNRSAIRHIDFNNTYRYTPEINLEDFRRIYSDHLPIIFSINKERKDDDAD